MKDLITIKCPKCGRHYLPSEIFYPDDFFGKQTNITRNALGEIEFYFGSDMDTTESYVCDECNTKLDIQAKLTFDVAVHTDEDFDEDFTVAINSNKLHLAESDLFA